MRLAALALMAMSALLACNEILGVEQGHCATCNEAMSECTAGFCPTVEMMCTDAFEPYDYLIVCGCNVCVPDSCTYDECNGLVPQTEACRACFQKHIDLYCAEQRNICANR